MKLLIALFLTLFSYQTFAAGFTAGEQFNAIALEGRLSVSCFDATGSSYGTTYCSSEILNPAEYSYFKGPNIDADSVTLQATWESGKVTKTKTEKYDAKTGKSKKSFNLWISTLLQRPLLDYGKNTVAYKLTKGGAVVEEGTFIVEVTKGEKRVCQRPGFYQSNNKQDCSFPSNFCSRYFQENNYCR